MLKCSYDVSIDFPRFYKFSHGVYVLVQFYPWFNFDFSFVLFHEHMIINIKQKDIKTEPTMQLNYNIYMA